MFGPVPVTRFLSKEEVDDNYELNTGKLIVERFKELDPAAIPAVLIAGHAPFTWGKNARDAVMNSFVLERVASMAFHSISLNPDIRPLPDYILNEHHRRKHGPDSYYDQPKRTNSNILRRSHRKRK